mgnify:CR=1 FL=1
MIPEHLWGPWTERGLPVSGQYVQVECIFKNGRPMKVRLQGRFMYDGDGYGYIDKPTAFQEKIEAIRWRPHRGVGFQILGLIVRNPSTTYIFDPEEGGQ